MGDNPPPIFGIIAMGFMNMAPAVFMIVSTVLLLLSLWLVRQTWRSVRILYGTTLAPVSDLHSAPRGLVKLRGTADAPAPPGMGPPGIVYQEIKHSNSSGGGYSSSTLRSTGWVLVTDGAQSCALDLKRATVMPTASEMQHAFLNRDRWSSNGIIHRGDAVFALGRVQPGPPKGTGAPATSCTLRPVSGVLLYSGLREGGVQFIYAVYLLIQTTLTILVATVLVWGALIHVGSYPEGVRGGFFTFWDALRATPFEPGAGLGHPGWSVPTDTSPS